MSKYIPVLRVGESEVLIMQGEDNKKTGRSERVAAANAQGDHDTGSKSQSGGNLGNDEKGKEELYRHVVS